MISLSELIQQEQETLAENKYITIKKTIKDILPKDSVIEEIICTSIYQIKGLRGLRGTMSIYLIAHGKESLGLLICTLNFGNNTYDVAYNSLNS